MNLAIRIINLVTDNDNFSGFIMQSNKCIIAHDAKVYSLNISLRLLIPCFQISWYCYSPNSAKTRLASPRSKREMELKEELSVNVRAWSIRAPFFTPHVLKVQDLFSYCLATPPKLISERIDLKSGVNHAIITYNTGDITYLIGELCWLLFLDPKMLKESWFSFF